MLAAARWAGCVRRGRRVGAGRTVLVVSVMIASGADPSSSRPRDRPSRGEACTPTRSGVHLELLAAGQDIEIGRRAGHLAHRTAL